LENQIEERTLTLATMREMGLPEERLQPTLEDLEEKKRRRARLQEMLH
jgi:hypothetical protein